MDEFARWFISLAVAGIAALGVSKYVLADIHKKQETFSAELGNFLELIESKATVVAVEKLIEKQEKIEEKIGLLVTKADCRTLQSGCGAHIAASNSEITKRLDGITAMIIENERSRNEQKDIRNTAIANLTAKIAGLDKQVGILDATIKLRSIKYRETNGKSKHDIEG